MDTSKEFSLMLNEAIKQYSKDFKDFDKTKNVQDQLQEMVLSAVMEHYYDYHDRPTICLYWAFKYWFEKSAGEEYIKTIHNSMEQLWLAFVMKERHGKQWSGNDWKE